MKLTVKSKYAIIGLCYLQSNYVNKPIGLKEISERNGLSIHLLEQVFQALRRAGFVTSARGPGGGYRPAEIEYDLSQVLEACGQRIVTTDPGILGAVNVAVFAALSRMSIKRLVNERAILCELN